jgi:hypothetical protein
VGLLPLTMVQSMGSPAPGVQHPALDWPGGNGVLPRHTITQPDVHSLCRSFAALDLEVFRCCSSVCSRTLGSLPATLRQGLRQVSCDSESAKLAPRPNTATSSAVASGLVNTPSRRVGRAAITWRRPFQSKCSAEHRATTQLLQCLSQFVSIPTVSCDQALHEECFRGAKYLAGLLEGMSMQVKLAMADKSVHPCVLARLEVQPDLPTLVFYGHYDVQPAQELVRRQSLICRCSPLALHRIDVHVSAYLLDA